MAITKTDIRRKVLVRYLRVKGEGIVLTVYAHLEDSSVSIFSTSGTPLTAQEVIKVAGYLADAIDFVNGNHPAFAPPMPRKRK